MSRLEATFARLREERRCALVPYVTAGDPLPAGTAEVMHALAAGGADVIELGLPFSDPTADGPVIQGACERAIENGMTPAAVFDAIAGFRERDDATPVVIMGYLNPMEAMGIERFTERAHAAGADGVLVVDMPPEEAGEVREAFGTRGLDLIHLLAPNTDDERCARICESATGFVYYVSLKGVTGSGGLDVDAVARRLAAIRRHTELPVGVGFGVRDAAAAAALAPHADAVIVGSALVERLHSARANRAQVLSQAQEFMATLREAMDRTRAGTVDRAAGN